MGRTMVIRCWCGVMVVYAPIAVADRTPFGGVWCANHRLHVDCSSFDTSSSSFSSFDFWLSPSSLEELMSAKFFSSIFHILLFRYFDFFCRLRRRPFEFHIFVFSFFYYHFSQMRWERCSRTAAAANAFACSLLCCCCGWPFHVRLREQIQIKLTFSPISYSVFLVSTILQSDSDGGGSSGVTDNEQIHVNSGFSRHLK